ncbi:hypothetical protein B0T17DRAFT_500206 [Bombardia bombarda]|uniref:DUF1857-domain-containing protein n=1 Tax=Bombardia bombarda TaxID=252184 RepID=A0AA39TKJ6_9PEZI|nr:hypothetical protein B0T17DRAFT_500206 [Bombardia bombarda]
MVTFNLSYSAPINRPGQSPVLTVPQVWAGLQRKVRNASEFVPLIVSCEVESDETSASGEVTVNRVVKFKPGKGPKADGAPVREQCNEYPPCRVDFLQENGSKITNCVSQGASGEEADLVMTYIFEWRHPGVEEGSDKARELLEGHRETAKMAVESSIETIRRLVKEGKI